MSSLIGIFLSKRTTFNRRTTNYQAWKEQMTICDLLEGYDPAVRPFGQNPSLEKSNHFLIHSKFHKKIPKFIKKLFRRSRDRPHKFIYSINKRSQWEEYGIHFWIVFLKFLENFFRNMLCSFVSSKSGLMKGNLQVFLFIWKSILQTEIYKSEWIS